jgi:hypothetical protein
MMNSIQGDARVIAAVYEVIGKDDDESRCFRS